MANILLVNCGRTAAFRHESLGYFGSSPAHELPKADIAPLAIATIAALTPAHYHVDLWDDSLEMLRNNEITDATQFEREYSIVGLSGYSVHLERMKEIAAIFKRRGVFVVAGGPGASAEPEELRGSVDVVFVNEAEKTWPKFLADWERSTHLADYFQIDKPELDQAPLPNWKNLAARLAADYRAGAVQTTRGCPFDCEFCDVVYLYGRRQRHKPIEHVIAELREQHRLGMRFAMLVDDEYVGDKKYALELTRAIRDMNRGFDEPITLNTQLTMTLAKDEELIALMSDANFIRALVGIETPNEASLRETGKLQNVRASVEDMIADIHRIQSYGMGIRSALIIGFDHDGPDIFERHLDFYQRACLPWITVNNLQAPMGTPLWTRLRQEGRVLDAIKMAATLNLTQSRIGITMVPKGMSFRELFDGFAYLYDTVRSWDLFADRMCGWMSFMKRPPDVRLKPATAAAFHEAIARFQPDEVAHRACNRIIDAVLATHPSFLGRAIVWGVWFAGMQTFYTQMRDDYRKLVELEKSGAFVPIFEEKPLRVPAGFVETLRPRFEAVHRHVYLSLEDPSRTAEAIHRALVDFVVRWGAEGSNFDGEKIEGYLRELADRTCASLNQEQPDEFQPLRYAGKRELPNHRRARLWESIVKSVSDELALIARAAVPNEGLITLKARAPKAIE